MRIARWLNILPLRLRALFLRNRVEEEWAQELEFHLQQRIEQLVGDGVSPAEAKAIALRAIDGLERQMGSCREARAGLWLDLLRADLVFGWRQLIKRKGSTATAVLSLGLAIGACTSAFRLIDALFLRPMAVSHPQRLYGVFRYGKGFSDGKPRVETSYEYPVFQQMQAAVRNEADVIAVSYVSRIDMTYRSDQEMEKAEVQYVSGRMFGVFGLQPTLGRMLAESDDLRPGEHPYAVLSYDYWRHRFGKDTGVIGRTLRIGENTYEIVGVGPKKFYGTEPGTVTDIFLPTMMNPGVTHPDWGWIRIFVMLKPEASAERVQEQLRAVFETLQRERVKEFSGHPKQFLERFLSWQVRLQRAPAGMSTTQDDYRLPLMALTALVALVLLIACANEANLMSAQSASRAGEIALRFSLGAKRRRLVQMVLIESTIMGAMAAALGLLFSAWATPFVVARIQRVDQPIRLALEPDWSVVLFGMGVTLAVTLMFGLLPALRTSQVQPVGALKGETEPLKRRRWMHALIAVQVAFCFVVLFVTGLFITTFEKLTQQPLGFSPDGLLLVEISAQKAQEPAIWDQTAELFRGVPGVVDVAQAQWPLLGGNTQNSFIAVNGEVNPELASMLSVSPGWLHTMNIPLKAGRDFRESDSAGDFAVVNETFARQYFGAQNPVGKRFAIQGGSGDVQIVGVVENAHYQSVREGARSLYYLPIHRTDQKGNAVPIDDETFLVRTGLSHPMAISEMLRKKTLMAHPELRITNVRTQQELIDGQTVRERLLAILATFFAGVSLFLAGIGLYGVLSYSVLQREREFGIRIAVGAPMRNIVQLIVGDVFALVAAGAVAGVVLGQAASRYVSTLLYAVKGSDARMLVAPSMVLIGAAVLAALPAIMRATRIDPAIMLKRE